MKTRISTPAVMKGLFEKETKYWKSGGWRNGHILKESWKLCFHNKTQKMTKCKKQHGRWRNRWGNYFFKKTLLQWFKNETKYGNWRMDKYLKNENRLDLLQFRCSKGKITTLGFEIFPSLVHWDYKKDIMGEF